jgi:hypothetical protein
MKVRYGAHEPVAGGTVPLSQAQEGVSISMDGKDRFPQNSLFTIIVHDLDVPDFVHFLSVNSWGKAESHVIIPYLAPQRVGHRYSYEVYFQPGPINLLPSTTREIDIAKFVREDRLSLVGSVTVITSAPTSTPTLTSGLGEVKYHGFVKDLTGPDAKYCTCTLEVEYKNKLHGYSSNPYAVCTHSTGGHMSECGSHYDWDHMPLEYLLTYTDRHVISVPDRSSRQSAIDAIMRSKGRGVSPSTSLRSPDMK